MKRYLLFILLLPVLCYSCKDDAVIPQYAFYQLVTNSPLVNSTGVTFTAKLEGSCEDVIIERGFVLTRKFTRNDYGYVRVEPITETYKISLDGEFQLRLEDDFDPALECSVYAYISTTKYNYRGESLDFSSGGSIRPIIHSVTPERGSKSGSLIVRGENFSKYVSRNKVYMIKDGREFECNVSAATQTELTVEYSTLDRIGYYDLKVKVTGAEEVILDDVYYYEEPKIHAISPGKVFVGDIITIEFENFSSYANVSVSVGGENIFIREQSDSYIKFICPLVEVGQRANIDIYFPDEQVRISDIDVMIHQSWKSVQQYTLSSDERYNIFDQKYVIVNNEAYGIYSDGLWKFDKGRLLWKRISSFPWNIYTRIIFGKGDFIYIIGQDDYGMHALYKYDISNDQWDKLSHPLLGQTAYVHSGEWINNEYYISANSTMEYNKHILLRYLPGTNIWESSDMDNSYRFFAVEGKAYAMRDKKLYEYDIILQKEGNLFFEFPEYANMETLDRDTFNSIIRKNGVIYFTQWHYNSVYLFKLDLISREIKSLGAPIDLSYGYDHVLPFEEGLYVRCKDAGYEYIGEY